MVSDTHRRASLTGSIPSFTTPLTFSRCPRVVCRCQTDRVHLQSQLEHLHAKSLSTGSADTSKLEWAQSQHRDSYASYISHAHMLDFFAVAEGKTRARVRHEMIHKMIRPCQVVAKKEAGTQ